MSDTSNSIWETVCRRPQLVVKDELGCQWCLTKRGVKHSSGANLCAWCVKVITSGDETKMQSRRAPLEGEQPSKEWSRAESKRVLARNAYTGDAAVEHRTAAREHYWKRMTTASHS